MKQASRNQRQRERERERHRLKHGEGAILGTTSNRRVLYLEPDIDTPANRTEKRWAVQVGVEVIQPGIEKPHLLRITWANPSPKRPDPKNLLVGQVLVIFFPLG